MRRLTRESRATLVGRLYDEHGPSLYRYALILVAEHGAAEDVLHQVFATLMRHKTELENAEHYLRRAVRNECYSMLRRRVSHPVVSAPLLESSQPEPVSADDRIALETAIVALPPDQREVVHLHVFEGMTFQEVAVATGESINTVSSRYRYALEKLRATLA